MNLVDLLNDAGAGQCIGAIGDRLNPGSAETRAMLEAVAPALSRPMPQDTRASKRR